jgi:membrane protease YdiL (CAAX protease family)
MEQENQPAAPEPGTLNGPTEEQEFHVSPAPEPEKPYHGLKWVFIGEQGLRAGWSVVIFLGVLFALGTALNALFARLHLVGGRGGAMTAKAAFFGELMMFLAMLGAAAVVAAIEHRSILDFNLRGPRRVPHFLSGLVAGFAALSALVGALAWGGWLHFGPIALSGSRIFLYAAVWGCVFLLVGCVEEGIMRCYLLFTLARGMNFWWAAGLVGAMCLRVFTHAKGNGTWGVYAIALIGVAPCLLLHMKRAPGSGFWQAAWVTSTFFGFGHTGNSGENWIGIFAAAAIGFVFCVSVWLTGSAWWAIGCHAAWDWAETYFYGTADSGMVAPGHYLSTSLSGNALWSGGADGPEGSLLVLPVILLLLALLLLLYRRPAQAAIPVAAAGQLAG